ncbi:MAG TPA: hypothetical protein VMZ22_10390 [Acidimicrobiales bacterium]|nr:hypothetical protein [Acidimicrobiales bacterium]
MTTRTVSARPNGKSRNALEGWFASVDELLGELGDTRETASPQASSASCD